MKRLFNPEQDLLLLWRSMWNGCPIQSRTCFRCEDPFSSVITFRCVFKTSSSDVTQILSVWNNKSRKQNLPVWKYSLCVLTCLRHSAGQFIANSAFISWRSVRKERLVPHRHSLSVLPTFEMHGATGLRASISSLCHILISFLLLQNAPHKQLERKGKLFWFAVSEIFSLSHCGQHDWGPGE